MILILSFIIVTSDYIYLSPICTLVQKNGVELFAIYSPVVNRF